MNKKLLGGIFGTALGLAVLATPQEANASFALNHADQSKIASFANVLSEEATKELTESINAPSNKEILFTLPSTSEKSIKNEDLKENKEDKSEKTKEVSSSIAPVANEEIENWESATGLNPIHFASDEISKVVKDWKVVGEQTLRSGTNLDSDVVFILKDGQELEVVEEDKDIAVQGWLKVKVKEKVNVQIEGKEKTEVKETIGYVNVDYIEVIDQEVKETVEKKNKMEIEVLQQKLSTEIKKEIEAELKAKEEAERKEREARELAEKEAKEKEEARAKEEARVKAQQQERAQAQQRVTQSSQQVTPAQKSVKVNAVRTAPQVSASASASSAISIAQRYLGTPYQYGASTGTTSVFDCSSFTKHVFAQMGVNLPRNSAAQAGLGVTVSKGNLQPGDLVFFNTSGGGISHVGIYVGNGRFIGAQSSNGVSYAGMNDSYWGSKFVTAKRIL